MPAGLHRRGLSPRPLLLAGLLGAGVVLLAGGGLIAAHHTVTTKDTAVDVAGVASQQAMKSAQATLHYCGLKDDFAHQLDAHGLCAVAESVRDTPAVANPQALISTPPPTGIPGRDGRDGRNGRDGVDGKDGKDGSPATSMTLNGSGVVYTCRRSGGSNTAPTYNCPGLGGVQPSISPFPSGPMFPSRGFPRPAPFGHGGHRSPPSQTDSPAPPDPGEPTP